MNMLTAMIIVGVVALLLLLFFLLRRPKRRLSRPATTVLKRPPLDQMTGHENERLPDPEELYPHYDRAGEPIPRRGRGPSPELLARMDAAGMNTTDKSWDEFESERRLRRMRPLETNEAGEVLARGSRSETSALKGNVDERPTSTNG